MAGGSTRFFGDVGRSADADDGAPTRTITALDAGVFDACNHCDCYPIAGGTCRGAAGFLAESGFGA